MAAMVNEGNITRVQASANGMMLCGMVRAVWNKCAQEYDYIHRPEIDGVDNSNERAKRQAACKHKTKKHVCK